MKKKITSLLGALIIGGILFNMTPAYATTNGWAINADNKWSYYDNGQRVTGWIRPDGYNWYYLNSNGDMLTGFQYIDGKWYYLNESNDKEGAMSFDNKVGPYTFGMDGSMIAKDNGALMPDIAIMKMEQHLLGKGYSKDEYDFYYAPFNRVTNKLGIIVCGKGDSSRVTTELYINLSTGKMTYN